MANDIDSAGDSVNFRSGAGTNYSIISNIDTNFIGNRVIATSQNAYGGAIYNTGSILALNGDFYENSVSSDNNVFGGGNYGIIGSSQRRCYRKTNSYI